MAQCTASGPNSGSSFSDDGAIGVFAFSSPGSAAASDDNRATASAIVSVLTGNTHYLTATGFGFSIPPSASICGITVEVEKSATNISGLAWVTDNSIQLLKNGTLTGNDYATGSNWTSTDAYYSYGGPADNWGYSWSASDINSANFGVAFSASITGIIGLLPNARIDHIRVTVNYFDLPLALNLYDFSATRLDTHQARLDWSISSNEAGGKLDIERSRDQDHWSIIRTIEALPFNSVNRYSHTDTACPLTDIFYRLKFTGKEGRIHYSRIVHIGYEGGALRAYPNPVTGSQLFIQGAGQSGQFYCMDMFGRTWPIAAMTPAGNNGTSFSIAHLPKGLYTLFCDGRQVRFLRN